MPRLFIESGQIEGQRVTITGDDAHYLLHVLRLEIGDSFEIVIPSGSECRVVIVETQPQSVVGEITQSHIRHTEPAVQLTLYQAMLKGKNFPLVIEKAVELGVGAIVPLHTHRTVVQPSDQRIAHKHNRWQKIAKQAAQQSERMAVPRVSEPMDFAQALANWKNGNCPGILFSARAVGDVKCSLRSILRELSGIQQLSIFVGPEGGFTAQEAEAAISAGLREANLGPRIMRAETAAITACAICMYELGQLDPVSPKEETDTP